MPKPLLLRFAERIVQGPHYHLTTVVWGRNRLPGYHTHDYPEIFWLTAGVCEHPINGVRERLEAGALYMLRARDAHQFLPCRGGGGFAFTNLSISPANFARLGRNYPAEVARLYPRDGTPTRCFLPRAELELLNEAARELAAREHSALQLDRMILGIWSYALRRTVAVPFSAGVPDWLQTALLRIEGRDVFSRGVPGLVEAAGRCHEHVARACRRHLGKTPSQLVTAARLRYATHALRLSSRSVTDIALDCGFENPAQFHRIFRAAYQTTPARYRRE